ncbi:MAG: hypothetical protein ACR2KK_03360 [Acidimicrobiales bacterium]
MSLLLHNDGELTARHPGALPAQALTDWLDAHAPAAWIPPTQGETT